MTATSKTAIKKTTAKTAVTRTPAADAAKPPVKVAPPKARQKLIRDSFTIPKSEYVLLEALKLRAANLARPTKKSEVLRAGIAALYLMTDKAFIVALDRVPSLKTGRPKADE
jgi:hypothetical protein